jgi:hypothetical protein
MNNFGAICTLILLFISIDTLGPAKEELTNAQDYQGHFKDYEEMQGSCPSYF